MADPPRDLRPLPPPRDQREIVYINVPLPVGIHRALKVMTAQHGWGQPDYVAWLIEEEAKRQGVSTDD